MAFSVNLLVVTEDRDGKRVAIHLDHVLRIVERLDTGCNIIQTFGSGEVIVSVRESFTTIIESLRKQS